MRKMWILYRIKYLACVADISSTVIARVYRNDPIKKNNEASSENVPGIQYSIHTFKIKDKFKTKLVEDIIN